LTLAPGQAATYTVTFTPSTVGTVTASESFTSNASNSPTAVVFLGTGVNAEGKLTASPASIGFGTVIVGRSSSRTITVTASTASVTISQILIAGSGFTVAGPTLPLTLAAGRTASFTVKFGPLAAANATGSFSLVSNASNVPRVLLTGVTVIPKGRLTANPASLIFGNIVIGDRSSRTITVTASTASVIISQASLTGTGFTFTGPTLPLTLAAGKTVWFTVTFTPTAAGRVTGNFSLASNAANAHLAVGLSGTGAIGAVHSVTLAWDASASRIVVGYYVYRGTHAGGPFSQIGAVPETDSSYTDSNVVSGMTYYYVVTALGSTGQQSAYSPETVATIPTP